MYIEIKWQKCIKAWKLAIWSNVKSRSEKKEKIYNVKKRSKWRNREKFWNFSFENWLAALIAAAADYWLAGVSKVLICGFQFIFFNGRYDFSHFSLLSHHFFFLLLLPDFWLPDEIVKRDLTKVFVCLVWCSAFDVCAFPFYFLLRGHTMICHWFDRK